MIGMYSCAGEAMGEGLAEQQSADLREAIRQAYRRDEHACVAALAEELQAAAFDQGPVAARARGLVEAVRRQRSSHSGVDHLMHEFSLSSQEGVALMCLAEALLRIPDTATADRLIRDKISKGDWRAHLHGGGPLFVNAATWGLMITGKLVSTRSDSDLGSALTSVIARGGEPLIRRGVDFAMRLLGQQFVMGESIAEALERSRENEERGYAHSFDMLGEAALTNADAERYFDAYRQAIIAIGEAGAGRGVTGGPGISVKLSALHPRYVRAQRQRVMAELLPRLQSLAKLAAKYAIGLNIDAEEADRLELSLDLLEALAFDADSDFAGWGGLGFVVQAYQKRCPFVIDWLVDLARKSGRRLMIRLVKGAYWDSEIKRAQMDGLADYPVFTRKVHSDLSYLACARRLLLAPDAIYPQFATHNAHTLASVMQMATALGAGNHDSYEFQCLHGMGEPLYDNVVGDAGLARRCRIYAPVGTHETLLPYLVRRLLENGANSSFVNRLVDETVAVEELIADPLQEVRLTGGAPHPLIPLPSRLYASARRNSAGVDLADEHVLAALDRALEELKLRVWLAQPLLAEGDTGSAEDAGDALPVLNPADHAERVGGVVEATAETVRQAVAIAEAQAAAWHATPVTTRAAMLERASDLLEAHQAELISLCLREAGKTRANAVAEVREAVDFCRYYAQEIRVIGDDARLPPPGPVACISPWNFPLAIFIGEVAAALAAGSPVLAKPAEQTPLIACLAVELLHRAGVPRAVLQFLPGRGETVGAALTADPRVAGVIFTGSTEVAQRINRTLAGRTDGNREIRLVAETGGQNAMIVDSSALPEQVVQDALSSAFDSAGQRCSALRVLCLQREIADKVLAMLQAAMEELSVGDPALLATDVGPVIDAEAKAVLAAHIDGMRAAGKPVFQLALPAMCERGSFVPPTLIDLGEGPAVLAELQHEVFGPVVHVLRFAAAELPALVEAINATGYGLTMGLHSRIDETIRQVTATARVGNLYVNRNMVGAVVGVQPFGGEGKSGTGPKAGGPLYLHRLRGSENVLPADFGGRRSEDAEALPVPFRVLTEWAHATGERRLAHACAEYAAITPLRHVVDLPGPTGERNTLGFAARGRVLCLADLEVELLAQLAAVLATGNQAVFRDEPMVRTVLAQLPAELRAAVSVEAVGPSPPCAAVLFDGAAGQGVPLQQRVAAGDGALVPVIGPDGGSGHYPLYRLVVERVVSVNTTAAGGNTTLMTLGA